MAIVAAPKFNFDTNASRAPYHYRTVFVPSEFDKLVRDCGRALAKVHKRMSFDGLVCCGTSGQVLAGALGFHMGVPVVTVRKASESPSSHHGYEVTGITKGRVLFFDDLISSGDTLRNVIKKIDRDTQLELVGAFLYQTKYRYVLDRHDMPPLPVYTLEATLNGDYPGAPALWPLSFPVRVGMWLRRLFG